jgi:predicted MPP superfamily phosphohydrolase
VVDIVLTLAIPLLIGGQIFWIRRLQDLGRKLIKDQARRERVGVAALAVYAQLALYYFVPLPWMPVPAHTRVTPAELFLQGPFVWWFFGSTVGYLLVLILRLPSYLYRAGRRIYQALAPPPASPSAASSRRRFLEQATVAAGTLPFVASFYGLVFGRLEVETTSHRVELERLPKAFEGFRIAQLSDIHIGPFMTSADIRYCVELANRLKPDLILVTGDYVIWDRNTQGAAVEALSGLRAPYGILGTLGNHELWTKTQDSISRLFAGRGVRILRQESTALRVRGDELNLIGVDYQTRRHMGFHHQGMVREYLEGIEGRVRRDTANILLSHNPNTFDRAAELGIDLSLAGHTHGGQVALEFISPEVAPSRLVTPYVAGWFEKPGGKLYVNRGLGTIGVPIRLGAPAEITVFELARKPWAT